MPRIRTIKPEFFTSETVSQLPLRARLTWIGLWTHCDDHGRARDILKLIQAAVWPLDDVSLSDIEADLAALEEHGLVVRYTVNGRHYLTVTNWDEHQAAAYRRGDSKMPAPPESGSEGANESWEQPPENGQASWDRMGATGHEQERASRTSKRASRTTEKTWDETGRNRTVQETCKKRAVTGNREQETGNARAHSSSGDAFDRFWAVYPKRVAKGHASKAWKSALKRGADPEHVIAAASSYATSVTDTDPRFVKHPATWLNAQCYDDEPEPEKPEPPRPRDVTAVPPPGLTPDEYAQWERDQRRRAPE